MCAQHACMYAVRVAELLEERFLPVVHTPPNGLYVLEEW
jgi:hypothetical protein